MSSYDDSSYDTGSYSVYSYLFPDIVHAGWREIKKFSLNVVIKFRLQMNIR